MSITTKATGRSSRFDLTLPSHQERNITVNADTREGLLAALKNELRTNSGATPLHSFVFGGCQHHAPFVKTYGEPDSPLTWVQGDACTTGTLWSAQTTAISGLTVKPISFAGRIVGTTYEDAYAKYVRLAGILPTDRFASREAQTRSLFENMRTILHEQGMRFTDTVRTWLYLDRLLEWYDAFNKMRTQFFQEEGVFDAMVPASTGIGGSNPHGTALIADLLAVRPKSEQARVFAVQSPLQGSALEYRSSFSRAVELELPTHRTLYISGTASIDANGKTAHLDDPDKQIALTMQVVEAILNSRKMNWKDVSRAIAYFTSTDDIPRYYRYCLDHGIAHFPLAISHADVCRDDLLFEIELDAIQLNQ